MFLKFICLQACALYGYNTWLVLGGQAPVVVTEAAASVFAQHVVPVTPPSRPNCESWTQAQVEEWISKELDR